MVSYLASRHRGLAKQMKSESKSSQACPCCALRPHFPYCIERRLFRSKKHPFCMFSFDFSHGNNYMDLYTVCCFVSFSWEHDKSKYALFWKPLLHRRHNDAIGKKGDSYTNVSFPYSSSRWVVWRLLSFGVINLVQATCLSSYCFQAYAVDNFLFVLRYKQKSVFILRANSSTRKQHTLT